MVETSFLQDEIKSLIAVRDMRQIRTLLVPFPPADIADLIGELHDSEKAIIFRILPAELAADVFEYLDVDHQIGLLNALGDSRVAIILNEMSADDRTQLLEEFPAAAAKQLVNLLSKKERAIALSLLGYPENSVGRLMTPDYVAVKSDWNLHEVLDYVRKNGQDKDTLNVLYVIDEAGRLMNDLRTRDILLSPLDKKVKDLMSGNFIPLQAHDHQEKAVEIFKKYDRTALPVTDSRGHLLGVVTVDDVLDVAEEEATEDIHKLGAVEVLEAPYIQAPLPSLIRKRVGWLVILFLGELLTASAMAYFEDEIAQAVVLALFVPLIISSGGNSGSQAATLVIRALAIGEITVSDWRKVLQRELISGLALGGVLGTIGFARIALWSAFVPIYGPHWLPVGLVVAFSLVAVVIWGTLSGAMLPLLLQRLGLDPATSSAPFVATMVDVTGLVIYFSIAAVMLRGLLL